MIRWETDIGWMLITQLDHARATGLMCAAWGRDTFQRSPYHTELTLATTIHDYGWTALDADGLLDADNAPLNFIDANLDITHKTWRSAVQAVAHYNLYSALLISQHARLIYTLRGDRGRDPAHETATAIAWLDQIDAQLFESAQSTYPDITSEQLNQDYRVLRTCDLICLALCTGSLAESTVEQVPYGRSQTTLTLTPIDDKTLSITPYPFDQPLVIEIPVTYVSKKKFADQEDFRRHWLAGKRGLISFNLTA